MSQLEQRPVQGGHHAAEDVVHQRQQRHHHKRNVGVELLPPGMRNAEGQHRKQIDVVDEHEDSIALHSLQTKTTINYVVDLAVVESSEGGPLLRLHHRKYHHAHNLAHDLDHKHYQDLRDVGYGEEGVPRFLHAQPVSCRSVAHEDDREEVKSQVPVQKLEIGWVLQEHLQNHSSRKLDQRIDGHNVEQREIGGQTGPALLNQLHHRRNVCYLGRERGGDGCLSLGER